jgi:hypothetical protein
MLTCREVHNLLGWYSFNMLYKYKSTNSDAAAHTELANGCLKPCGHKFCGTCIKQLKKRAVFLATEGVMCPHCRQPVKGGGSQLT